MRDKTLAAERLPRAITVDFTLKGRPCFRNSMISDTISQYKGRLKGRIRFSINSGF